MRNPRTLLIDNYDSYSYNLYQLIAQVNGDVPTVIYNNELDLDELCKHIEEGRYDNIVISPGPGTPLNPEDIGNPLDSSKNASFFVQRQKGVTKKNNHQNAGVCVELFKLKLPIPILGVCLGHQALATAFNGQVIRAPQPVHGRLSSVVHSRHPLFKDIPSGEDYAVVRYHSLIVDETSLPSCLQPIAWTMGEHHALSLDATSPRLSTMLSMTAKQQAAKAMFNTTTYSNANTKPILEQKSGSPVAVADSVLDGRSNGDDDGLLAASIITISTTSCGDTDSPSSSSKSSDRTSEAPLHLVAHEEENASLLMGLAHNELPYYSVQYHPESVATGYGASLLRNFKTLTCDFYNQQKQNKLLESSDGVAQRELTTAHRKSLEQASGSLLVDANLQLCVGELKVCLGQLGGSEGLFKSMVLHQNANILEDTFWLDSSANDRGRFSFMGGRGGKLWKKVSYKLPNNSASTSSSNASTDGTMTTEDYKGSVSTSKTKFWPWLAAELDQWKCDTTRCTVLELSHSQRDDDPTESTNSSITDPTMLLPFNFWGGYVGYMGYELKAECGGKQHHVASTPDASFFLADQLFAVDHATGSVYVVALYEKTDLDGAASARDWVTQSLLKLQSLVMNNGNAAGVKENGVNNSGELARGNREAIVLTPRENHDSYLANIDACMQALYAGDSYEICLTTTLATTSSIHPWDLYLALRKINPAPYAAWLNFGTQGPTICCSSPERFLRGERGGRLEAKPIKGTARRVLDDVKADAACAAALEASEKDRAENLMIVDLLRNDLGRVCETGSVHVPALMQIESFATVHQLVSTVRGKRCKNVSVVDCLKAAFPGGSMTGAPKIRTMQIIDSLEQGPRGVYSGSIGYISFNDTFDMNIVIRTAVFHNGQCTIGAGGAIVAQSDPESEWQEMRLKCGALLQALKQSSGVQVHVDAGDD